MPKPLLYWRLNLLDPPRLPTVRRSTVHHGWTKGGVMIVRPREYEVVVEWGSWQVNSYAPVQTLAWLKGVLKLIPFRFFGWLP